MTENNKIAKRTTTLDRKSTQSRDPSYKEMVKRIGGVKGLRELANYSKDPKAKVLLQLLDDPANSSFGVKKLAQRAGMTLVDVAELVHNKYFMDALMESHKGLVEVVKTAVKYAQEQQESCGVCEGEGIILPKKEEDVAKVCKKCKGTGILTIKPDKDARDFIGKATKFVGENPMVQVNTQINNSNNNAPISGSFEDLMKRAEVVSARKVEDDTFSE